MRIDENANGDDAETVAVTSGFSGSISLVLKSMMKIWTTIEMFARIGKRWDRGLRISVRTGCSIESNRFDAMFIKTESPTVHTAIRRCANVIFNWILFRC